MGYTGKIHDEHYLVLLIQQAYPFVLKYTFFTENQVSTTNHLIWIDLEMTGLDVDQCRIIEIATIVTDKDLNIVAEGPVFAIHQDKSCIDAMDAWNQKHHGESGLIKRVAESKIDEKTAEQETLSFLEEHTKPGKSPLCGNSIYVDRAFLKRYMPNLERYFHYRMIDVSTVKELAKRWQPKLYSAFKKEGTHKALDDIRESIAELRYYREHWLTCE